MGNFFYRTYQTIAKNRIISIGVLLVIVAILSFFASKIKFEDDITSLIPANEETIRIQKVLKSISFTDKIIVNIEKGPNASVDELTLYATAFMDSILHSHPNYIKHIQGKVNDEDVLKTFDFVYDNLPLFLDGPDYTKIQLSLLKDSIKERMAQNYRTLVSPTGIVAKKSILKDPLGMSFIALKKLQKLGVAEDFTLKNGFLVNKDETNILLFITPTFPSSATVENKPLSDGLYALKDQLMHKFGNQIGVSFFGASLVAVANAGQIKTDIQFTVSIAMTLLVVLLMLFYKRITLPLILFAPTVFGALLAVAFLSLIRSHISAISLGIGAILLGVTLDYALHILTHIRNGSTIKKLYEEVASSVIMSSLTTASAFLCLLFLDSQALQDLGIFAAVSVSGASIFALLCIPHLYQYKAITSTKQTIIDRLSIFEIHKNRWALGVVVLLVFLSIFTYSKVNFNQDISKLNYESDALITARKKLENLTDIESKSIYLSTFGKNQEEVLQQNDQIFHQLEALKKDNKIVNFTSVGSIAKSNKTQGSKIADWHNFWTSPQVDSLQNTLNFTGNTLGFKQNTFDPFYNWLQSDFKPATIQQIQDIKAFNIEDYIVEDENGITVTSLVKLNEGQLENLTIAFSNTPNTLLINRKQVNETFLGTLKNDFNRLLGYSLLTVVVILLLFYRSLSLTMVTAIPIFVSWFLTVGVMGLLGIEFNIFNIIICSFIFGLGVDYSIFITNGFLTEYRTGEKSLPTHKTSILFSVITTIAGVGVMIFAKHPALYTISKVSLIGIFSAAFVAFVLQPWLFHLFVGNTKKRPISLRYFVHSVLSFLYFGLGGLLFSVYAWVIMKINPNRVHQENLGFHKSVSKLMGSVLYTNPFVKKKILNPFGETFEKPTMIIANHTSFLDILCIGMLHPKIIFLVNDWVYNSPIFGSAAKLAGAYPVSGGIENGEAYLKEKVNQGFSLIAFPEGTRSKTNKINRFHKGAFYLAERFKLDILPVLIHGNSEVLPKGSFVIRDGCITVKILERIPYGVNDYGNYTKQGKLIGAFFRKEFRQLRDHVEPNTYWHKTVLEHYRFKGTDSYKKVKEDLKNNSNAYSDILKLVDKKQGIIHLSNDDGQLDLLLALDSIDRVIHTYLNKPYSRMVLKNNFLTHRYSKVKIYESQQEALAKNASTLLIDTDLIDSKSAHNSIKADIHTVILLKSGQNLNFKELLPSDFQVGNQNDTFIVLNKKNT
ncbi:1-acyl-sn-glycerol-3-phosphate acyltransferase [Maribacter sp. CXY002]|uniref:1-acyl-sn-glycerol-3-phosphate acyltransferase n=1 Tax=Maribacter luteocoastalis TaxID=3407671 RepID=UPI003B66C9A3